MEKDEKKGEPEGKPSGFHTLNGLVEVLGVQRYRLQQALRDIPPAEENGHGKRWTVAQAVRALELINATGRPKVDRPKSDKDEQDARLKRAQADQMELKLARARGELVPVDSALRLFGEIVMSFRARMLQFPSKAAGKVLSAKGRGQIEAKLEVEANEVLSEFSRFNPEDFLTKLRGLEGGFDGDVSEAGPSAKADS